MRGAQRALRAGTRRRVLPLPPAAALESAARASGWAGSASAASWREFNRFLRGGARRRVLHHRRRRRARCARCATSSRSTPTRCCRPTRRRCSSARWRIRSTAPCTIPSAAASCAATASCSRASASRCRARIGRASRRSTRGIRASTRTRPRSPTSTRTCSARGASPARGSTMWTRSSRRRADASPRTPCSRHDLIEGSYARAGLATDIEVYDDYPARYLAYTRRKHRWIRGDWQLLRWLAPPGAGPGRAGAQPAVAALALEDLRQPAPQPGRDRAARVPRRRLDGAARLAVALDRCSAARRVAAPWIVSLLLAVRPAAVRQVVARLLRAGRARRGHERAAGRARRHLPAAPGVDLRRRDRAHAVADCWSRGASARVADGVAGGARDVGLGARRLAHDVARGRDRRRSRSSLLVLAAPGGRASRWPLGAGALPLHRAVDGVPADRAAR